MKGETTSAYSSMVTKVTFGLLRSADDHFTALNPAIEEHADILDFLKVQLVSPHASQDVVFITCQDKAQTLPDSLSRLGLGELLCPQGLLFLKQILAYLEVVICRIIPTAGNPDERGEIAQEAALWRDRYPFAKVLLDNAQGFLSPEARSAA